VVVIFQFDEERPSRAQFALLIGGRPRFSLFPEWWGVWKPWSVPYYSYQQEARLSVVATLDDVQGTFGKDRRTRRGMVPLPVIDGAV
jgi:hypothetical protein